MCLPVKFTKLVHNDKECIEYVTTYKGSEAIDNPENRTYELSGVSAVGNSENLFVYLDDVRRYENNSEEIRDYIIADNKKVRFNYKIKNESNVKLIVTEKLKD